MGFVLRVLINGVAIWLATLVLSGLTVVGGDSTAERAGIVLLVALIFGIVNAVVKPLVAFLSFPLYILTLGLFTLVVNALMLMLTAWITERADWGLRIDDFWTALIGALVIAVVSFVLSVVVPKSRD
ncbi:phage holin family protein [Cellulomonas cellasea]|uniref:Membrane protein n=2 Tax=Cellulomonas cellasea TaxID=43670 RepID=A0A0A0B3E7_9CELL|nr:phage holin family protein [Cellulomonas cellasea]KGM00712.1 membrane protein [Cellulomonas cellasea DSM 20118]GEA86961.1 membrane protein [Cellulomonas cellasea]